MAITLTYITTVLSTADATTYDLGDVSFPGAGTAIVVAAGRSSGSSRTISTVSIGGTNGSIVADSGSAANTSVIAVRDVSSGNNNITLTFSGAVARAVAAVYLMTGHASNTPVDTSTFFSASSGTTNTFTLDFPSGGGTAVYGVIYAAGTISWPAATPDADGIVESPIRFSSANKTTSGSGNTESPTWGSNTYAGASAVWEPSGGGGTSTPWYYMTQQTVVG